MEISHSLHPLEIARRIRLIYQGSIADYHLRFPEVRERKELELNLYGETETAALRELLIQDFGTNHNKISLFDWPILSEWNERFQQKRCLLRISSALKSEIVANDSLSAMIYDRLKEIYLQLSADTLKDPSVLQIFLFRFRNAPLRDEANYFLERLGVIDKKSAA